MRFDLNKRKFLFHSKRTLKTSKALRKEYPTRFKRVPYNNLTSNIVSDFKAVLSVSTS